MALSEFLAPERAKQEEAREEARRAYEQRSREREAEMDAIAFERSAEGRRQAQEEANRMAKFRSLARQKGFKGSAVNAAAELLMAEEERKAAESAADIAASEALTASRLAPKPTAYDKAEQLIDRLIKEGRIDPSQKNVFLLRALKLEKSAGGDFNAILSMLGVDTETTNDSSQGNKATVTFIDGQPV